MRTARAATLFVAIAMAAPVGIAHADDVLPDEVLVVIATCAELELDRDGLAERLRVELVSDGVERVRRVEEAEVAMMSDAGTPLGLAVLRIVATDCETGGWAFEVRIDDLVTRKYVVRAFDLDETPPSARARALAIAAAELLRASWAELVILPAGPADAPPAIIHALEERVRRLHEASDLDDPRSHAASVDPAPSAATRTPRLALAGAFVVRTFPEGRVSPLGGRLSLDVVATTEIVVRVDLEAATGWALDPLGAIELGYASAGAAVAWVVGAGDTLLLSVGPRLGAGAGWTAGRAHGPGTFVGSGIGPLITVGVSLELDLRVTREASLRFGVEAAGVIVGLEALSSGIPVAGLRGATVGAWGGLAIAP